MSQDPYGHAEPDGENFVWSVIADSIIPLDRIQLTSRPGYVDIRLQRNTDQPPYEGEEADILIMCYNVLASSGLFAEVMIVPPPESSPPFLYVDLRHGISYRWLE